MTSSGERPRNLRSLPGPRGNPLSGNLFQIDAARVHVTLQQWTERYGPMYLFRLGHRRFVVIAEPDLIQQVLRERPHRFRRIGSIGSVFREMGLNGVFSAEGADWQRQRRIVMQGFNSAQLMRFLPTLVTITERLRRRWAQPARTNAVLDMGREFKRYTVDVTTNLAFGYDMNTLEKGEDVVQRHLEHVFPMISRRVRASWRYWRWLKLPADRALDRALAAAGAVVHDVVRRRRAEAAGQPRAARRTRDFLDAMLAAYAGDDRALTDEELFGNVFAILLAGEDTTANTMAWAMHLLLEHPEAAARVRAEADAVLGDRPVADSMEDLERLSFLDAVAHETMRLKPVVPVIYLETNDDTEIDGVWVPGGTALALLTAAPALDARRFSAPREFRPERWIDGARAGCPVHDTRAYFPFGGGPRFCPGRNLALLEVKAGLSMAVRNFEFERPEGAPPPQERLSFTMAPSDLGIRIKDRAGALAPRPT